MMEARRTQEDSRRVSRGRMRVKAEGVGWSIDQEQVFTGNARRELFTRGPRGRNSAGRKFIYLLSPAREASATKILFSTESRLSCIATRSRTYVPRQLASKKLFHSADQCWRNIAIPPSSRICSFCIGELGKYSRFFNSCKNKNRSIVYSIECREHSIAQNTIQSILYRVQSIVQYRVQSAESIVQYRVQSIVQSILYRVQRAQYSVEYKVQTVQYGIEYIIQSIEYRDYSIEYYTEYRVYSIESIV